MLYDAAGVARLLAARTLVLLWAKMRPSSMDWIGDVLRGERSITDVGARDFF